MTRGPFPAFLGPALILLGACAGGLGACAGGASPSPDAVEPSDAPGADGPIADGATADARWPDAGFHGTCESLNGCSSVCPALVICVECPAVTPPCLDCVFQATAACGAAFCPDQTGVVQAVRDCAGAPNPAACVYGTRGFFTLAFCTGVARLSGRCEDEYAPCGVPDATDPCAACRAARRTCAPDHAGCGPCIAGHAESGGNCLAVPSCEGADCGAGGRCVVDGSVARCECEPGWAAESGLSCAAVTTNFWVRIVAPGHPVTFAQGQDDRPEASPCHAVTLARPFALQQFEVTVAEYDRCVRAGACGFLPGGEQGRPHDPLDPRLADHPAIGVPLPFADQYCRWIGGRLPTESEWEYAALKRTSCADPVLFPWRTAEVEPNRANFTGSDHPFADDAAPFTAAGGPTTPVGFFDGSVRTRATSGWIGGPDSYATRDGTSPFGLSDLAGNVAEWVADCWHAGYDGAPVDGSAWIAGTLPCDQQVKKGEAWADPASAIRGTFRAPKSPWSTAAYMGFRCARDL